MFQAEGGAWTIPDMFGEATGLERTEHGEKQEGSWGARRAHGLLGSGAGTSAVP